jgi:Ulp1 protease family, C-terminal catalytic domain
MALPALPEKLHTRQTLLSIPITYRKYIPNQAVSVVELLAFDPPPLLDPSGIDLTPVFSPRKPTINPALLQKLPVPPLDFTHTAKSAFEQARFNGQLSIVHPQDMTVHLPFWILTYWERMWHVLTARTSWFKARKWLQDLVTVIHPMSALVTKALNSLTIIGWDIFLSGPAKHLLTRNLTPLLSTSEIAGNLLDGILLRVIDHINVTQHLSGKVLLEDLSFSQTLGLFEAEHESYHSKRSFQHLRDVGDRLASGAIELAIIPLNVKGVHWAVFFIDVQHLRLQYGDSLGWDPPMADVQRIQRWLQLHGFPTFSEVGHLPSGRQDDSYSCAIAMVNTIEHFLFDEPIFINLNKHYLRIREYILLIEPLLNVRSHLSIHVNTS